MMGSFSKSSGEGARATSTVYSRASSGMASAPPPAGGAGRGPAPPPPPPLQRGDHHRGHRRVPSPSDCLGSLDQHGCRGLGRRCGWRHLGALAAKHHRPKVPQVVLCRWQGRRRQDDHQLQLGGSACSAPARDKVGAPRAGGGSGRRGRRTLVAPTVGAEMVSQTRSPRRDSALRHHASCTRRVGAAAVATDAGGGAVFRSCFRVASRALHCPRTETYDLESPVWVPDRERAGFSPASPSAPPRSPITLRPPSQGKGPHHLHGPCA